MSENNELFEELFNDWITLVEQDLADGNENAQDLYDRVCDFLKYEREAWNE